MSVGRWNRASSGFTLIELLVVVGIIAVLIAVLLPTLASARRQANQVRCLASLKEIGNGLKLYALEFRGAWPVAVHQQGPYSPAVPLLPEERRWYDLLARYVASTRDINTSADIATIRRKSVVWGCPEWVKSNEYDPSSAADKLRVGYAMQYTPMIDTSTALRNFAYIGTSGVVGQYIKGTVWNRRGSERGVIGCSELHVVALPMTFSRSTSQWMPFAPADPTQPQFTLDSTRHLKRGVGREASARLKGLNLLFADGHATPVTIVEAWTSMRCPGRDGVLP